MLPDDCHLHTRLCKHADGEPPEYRNVARSRGLQRMCFTDHAPAPSGYDPRHRMRLPDFGLYRNMVASMQDGAEPSVGLGIEADYYPDCVRFLEKWLPEQEFDLVLGSVHYIDGWGFDNPSERAVWDSADVPGAWRRYFEMIGDLADTGVYDVVAHLDLPKKFGHRPPRNELNEMARRALDRIAAAGMGIEINTSGLRRPVNEIYPSADLLSLARERDIPICFGSDAHSPEETAHSFEQAVELARAAGYVQYARYDKRNRTLADLPAQQSERAG